MIQEHTIHFSVNLNVEHVKQDGSVIEMQRIQSHVQSDFTVPKELYRLFFVQMEHMVQRAHSSQRRSVRHVQEVNSVQMVK